MERGARVRTGRLQRGRFAATLALALLVGAASVAPASAENRSRGRNDKSGRSEYKSQKRGRAKSHVEVRRVEPRRNDTRVVRPRVVRPRVETRHWDAPRWTAPRYEVRRHFPTPRERVVYWRERPYFWNVNVGVYVPELWVNVSIGDALPRGAVFVDRYCGRNYTSLVEYHDHCRGDRHPLVVDVVYRDDSYDYEPLWAGDYGSRGGCDY